MKIFTVNKNIDGERILLTVNDISLTCYKTTKLHLVVLLSKKIVSFCYSIIILLLILVH